jgi:hypothetical protein
MAFVFGGFTCPINNVLMLNGYQAGAGTGEIAPPMSANNLPDAALARVTAGACASLITAAAGTDTKVYVIKYKTTNATLDSCVPAEKITTYSANSEEELNEKLHEIAADIKSFAEYSAPRTEEIDP